MWSLLYVLAACVYLAAIVFIVRPHSATAGTIATHDSTDSHFTPRYVDLPGA